MKKATVFLLTAVMALSLFTACGGGQNGVGSIPSEEVLKNQAEALTDHLINHVLNYNDIENLTITADKVYSFAFTTGIYSPEYNQLNGYSQYHPYGPDVSALEGGNAVYVYKIEDIGKAAYELFGLENINLIENHGNNFDKEEKAFNFQLDVGYNYVLSCENLTSAVKENTVETYFTLLVPAENAEGPGEWAEAGNYKLVFHVLTENGKAFLRLASFEPVE